VSPSIAISVFKTLNLFVVAAWKKERTNSLRSAVSKSRGKKKAKRLDIFVSKQKQDPWVSSVVK
jgi:hypothetical protein